MSKLGKRYTLFSSDSQKTSDFYNKIKSYEVDGVKIENITENYNKSLNLYEGKIIINGPIDILNELAENASANFTEKKLDSIFTIDTHYDELLELKTEALKPSSSLADSLDLYKCRSSFEYNFLVRNYESYLNENRGIEETALPYFYEVLEDFVSTENVEGFGTTFFETPAKVITSNIRQDLVTNIVPYEVLIDDKKIRIDKYLEKYNPYKEQFPFYTDINFDTHELKNSSLSEALHAKSLFAPLVQTTINNTTLKNLLFVSPGLNEAQKIIVKEMNVDTFLNNVLDTFVEGDFTYIFDINQRINNKARDFAEIMMGEKEYSEVIGYHLKKYDALSNVLLQEWYLPNVSDAKMFWVDSQIKYDKLYTYKLDPIILTFGTEYQFTRVSIDRTGRLVIDFTNIPIIKGYIFQRIDGTNNTTLGSQYTNRLLDYPPMEPEIELVPYIGIDKMIKINFNTSIGQKTVPAINFNQTEEIQRDKLRLAQNKDTNSPLLSFQTDEPADSIEIYRLEDKKPSGYEDFFGSLLSAIKTNNSSGASYVDNIKPNKKYYYIARCVDYHGNISNPTPLYELEILNDNGLIIPNIAIVEFDKKENLKQQSKEFKQYLKILPALRHRLVNVENSNQNDIELGIDNIKPWNKRFKLRLTSKSTGKKMDINFTFKYKKPE